SKSRRPRLSGEPRQPDPALPRHGVEQPARAVGVGKNLGVAELVEAAFGGAEDRAGDREGGAFPGFGGGKDFAGRAGAPFRPRSGGVDAGFEDALGGVADAGVEDVEPARD